MLTVAVNWQRLGRLMSDCCLLVIAGSGTAASNGGDWGGLTDGDRASGTTRGSEGNSPIAGVHSLCAQLMYCQYHEAHTPTATGGVDPPPLDATQDSSIRHSRVTGRGGNHCMSWWGHRVGHWLCRALICGRAHVRRRVLASLRWSLGSGHELLAWGWALNLH